MMPTDTHPCVHCNGEGGVGPLLDVDCGICRGEGECTGALDRNGECDRCGWSEDGPDDVGDTTGPSDATVARERAWREKRGVR